MGIYREGELTPPSQLFQRSSPVNTNLAPSFGKVLHIGLRYFLISFQTLIVGYVGLQSEVQQAKVSFLDGLDAVEGE